MGSTHDGWQVQTQRSCSHFSHSFGSHMIILFNIKVKILMFLNGHKNFTNYVHY
jgi:hypothetical protein